MKQNDVQKNVMHYLLLAVLLFTFYSCKKSDSVGTTTTPPAKQTDITTIDSKVATFMSTNNIQGASLAVTKNGKLVYIKGYGMPKIYGTTMAAYPVPAPVLCAITLVYVWHCC